MTINANSPAANLVKYRWWEEPEQTVASAMSSAAQNIEKYSWHRRLLNLVCTRYMTGREMTNLYSYAMARRPASLTMRLRNIDWTAPTDNIIATCGDVYRARIWKERTFIITVPISGNFKAFIKSIQISRFIDAVFHDTDFWTTYELCGDDCMTVGDGFIKVHESPTEKKKICITRVLGDEILVNEEEVVNGGYPRSMMQRCFMHREELIAQFGATPELRDAIWNAPGAFPGLYYGDLAVQDIVPFVEGWHIKGYNSITDKEDEGRLVTAINNVLLDDRPFKKRCFPFAKLTFARLPTGYFNQGLAEQLLPYQAELNRYDSADWENQQRMSWPTVLNPVGSMVGNAQLQGSSGRVISHAPNLAPQFVFPDATNALAEQRRARIKQDAFLRARISQSSAMSQKPEGLNSGTAILAWRNIEDAAHADLGQRGEAFVTEVAELVTDLAEDIKPKVTYQGRTLQEIKWDDVRLSNDSYHVRAFPMSTLPQLPAARQQTIDNWYANGQITKSIKMRLEQMPDIDGWLDLTNAALNDIFMTLDNIIESGDYVPPEPFQDLASAIQIAQSRWLQERVRGTPADRLELLLQWIMQANELIKEGASQPIGIQQPEGAPAAPPMQVSAAQGKPQQLNGAQ
jgi:hypothetical protein